MGIKAVYKKSTYNCGIRIFKCFSYINTEYSSSSLWFLGVSSSFGWGISHEMIGECFRLSFGFRPLAALLDFPLRFWAISNLMAQFSTYITLVRQTLKGPKCYRPHWSQGLISCHYAGYFPLFWDFSLLVFLKFLFLWKLVLLHQSFSFPSWLPCFCFCFFNNSCDLYHPLIQFRKISIGVTDNHLLDVSPQSLFKVIHFHLFNGYLGWGEMAKFIEDYSILHDAHVSLF